MDISVNETEGLLKLVMHDSDKVYMFKAVTSEIQHRD